MTASASRTTASKAAALVGSAYAAGSSPPPPPAAPHPASHTSPPRFPTSGRPAGDRTSPSSAPAARLAAHRPQHGGRPLPQPQLDQRARGGLGGGRPGPRAGGRRGRDRRLQVRFWVFSQVSLALQPPPTHTRQLYQSLESGWPVEGGGRGAASPPRVVRLGRALPPVTRRGCPPLPTPPHPF